MCAWLNFKIAQIVWLSSCVNIKSVTEENIKAHTISQNRTTNKIFIPKCKNTVYINYAINLQNTYTVKKN